MIEGVAEPNEAWLDRTRIDGFQRKRFEEMFDLSSRIGRRLVTDGFAGKAASDHIDRTTGDFEDRSPRGLECDRPSRFSERWFEMCNRRLGAFAGYSDDKL